jgi:2-hydroxy-3-keto-5-methylthiopentenyl-1-phosphate phosphatase
VDKRTFKIFMDFDGTVTQQDVGEEVFRKFAEEEKVNIIIDDLLNDRISSRESWIKLCSAVPSVNINEFDDFIVSIPLDHSFVKFKDYCKNENIELYILSDGFDYYIDKIFEKNRINDLTVYSNHLEIVDDKLIPSFPYYDEAIFSSANCKRNHIINHSSEEDFTVFIGDGNSDKDSIEYCDFIFAKDDLLKFCEKERITYFPFKNFDDVIKKLDELKGKKRLKKRLRAQLKRQQAYTTE